MVRSPYRVSFAGGGTDIEPYCSLYGGSVLTAAIAKYAYAVYDPESKEISENQIGQAILKHFGAKGNLTINSNVPMMSGLGGSATCCVAGIKAVLPELNELEIAQLAFEIERNEMGVIGGYQDQVCSAIGGLLFIEFGSSMQVTVKQLDIPEGLEELLLLVYLGKRNNSGHDIIKDQLLRPNKKALDLSKEIVTVMKYSLRHGKLEDFGRLLNEAWKIKKEYSSYITNSHIDDFYEFILRKGALGAKLTGAGGGGYMVVMEHPNRKGEVRKHLDEYELVKFDLQGVIQSEEGLGRGTVVSQ